MTIIFNSNFKKLKFNLIIIIIKIFIRKNKILIINFQQKWQRKNNINYLNKINNMIRISKKKLNQRNKLDLYLTFQYHKKFVIIQRVKDNKNNFKESLIKKLFTKKKINDRIHFQK